MRISQEQTECASGFTLIEMLVVLTIVSLIAAAVVGGLDRPSRGIARTQAVSKLEAAVRDARRDAVSTGTRVYVDPQVFIPGAVVTAAWSGAGASAGSLIFYADGSSSGGVISLDEVPLVTVDWLTGQVSRAR